MLFLILNLIGLIYLIKVISSSDILGQKKKKLNRKTLGLLTLVNMMHQKLKNGSGIMMITLFIKLNVGL